MCSLKIRKNIWVSVDETTDVSRSLQISLGFWRRSNIRDISSVTPGNLCNESKRACVFNEAI
jgi:hypothetical protein